MKKRHEGIFLSVTAGQGHNQTGKAAMECLLENKVECVMLDAFEYINPFLKESISQGYLLSTKLTPALTAGCTGWLKSWRETISRCRSAS